MSASIVPAVALQRTPRALLLDFGGVLVLTRKRTDGRTEFAGQVVDLLSAAGVETDRDRVRASLDSGLTALTYWKHASSRLRRPTELTSPQVVEDYLFSDLDDRSRAILRGHASALLAQMGRTITEYVLREGVRELVELAQTDGIALGIVSNAHSGRSHRQVIAELGLAGAFGVQLYSDEAGIRKPHPDLLLRAARGLGVVPQDCWYVGDTLDRDLVAGRRAGMGAVLLTRSQHTAQPPFPIVGEPDAILDHPGQLCPLLTAAMPGAVTATSDVSVADQPVAAPDRAPRTSVAPAGPVQALLIDHGGVISRTMAPAQRFGAVAQALEELLARAGRPIEPGRGIDVLSNAQARYQQFKAHEGAEETFREVSPRRYWGEFTSDHLDVRQREIVLSDAEELHPLLYRSKSRKVLRAGAGELLRHCATAGIPVVVVSNTLSGRGVRGVLRDYGLNEFITGWVFSDEVGLKKPHPEIFRLALRMAAVPPEHALMLGDKAFNDAFGAQRVGIGHRVLTRGGSGTEPELQRALADGIATDLVDDAGQVIALMRTGSLVH